MPIYDHQDQHAVRSPDLPSAAQRDCQRNRAREFEPGESLPTVRQMVTDLGINTMTVSKAYQLLKTEGFLETDRRKGTTICYPTSSAPQDNRFDEKLADELELLSAEAKFHGMTLTDFLELCQRTFNEMEVTVK